MQNCQQRQFSKNFLNMVYLSFLYIVGKLLYQNAKGYYEHENFFIPIICIKRIICILFFIFLLWRLSVKSLLLKDITKYTLCQIYIIVSIWIFAERFLFLNVTNIKLSIWKSIWLIFNDSKTNIRFKHLRAIKGTSTHRNLLFLVWIFPLEFKKKEVNRT